jgi:hypothetical protein
MSYQNLNRLPIIEGPIATYTVERNVYGDDEEVAGWFIVEHHAIHGVDILSGCHADRASALDELDQILA